MSPQRSEDRLIELVRQLIRLPAETSWVEFKENNDQPESIGEYLSALANSAALSDQERGYLLWGVRDGDHKLVGTKVDPAASKVGNEDLRNWLLRLLAPQVHFEFLEVKVEGHRIVVLEVDHAAFQPVSFKGTEYIRVGSHKKKLKDHPDHARRLWRVFDQTPFEHGIALADVQTDEVTSLLDFPAYFELMGRALPSQVNLIVETFEQEQMIVRSTGGRWNITNLGAISFAKHLDSFPSLTRKTSRVIQYKGNSRISTIKEQTGVRGYASGFKGLIEFTSNLLPSNEVIGQALRQTVSMYPDLALRELIANALIHQDFSLSGTGPMIEIFDDRIEITNPGTPLIDPDRFVDSAPRSRNELLAAMMRRVGICEERGSGWDKIAFEIEFHQLPAPLVVVSENHTKVQLFGYLSLNDMDRDDRIRAVYLHACLRHVMNKRLTNASIRERFKIEDHNSARASRLIKEAVDAGFITPRDATGGLRLRDYVPWWAAHAVPTAAK